MCVCTEYVIEELQGQGLTSFRKMCEQMVLETTFDENL